MTVSSSLDYISRKIVCRQRWVDRRGVYIGTEVNGISGRVLSEASRNMEVSNRIIGDRRIGRLRLHAARTLVRLFSPPSTNVIGIGPSPSVRSHRVASSRRVPKQSGPRKGQRETRGSRPRSARHRPRRASRVLHSPRKAKRLTMAPSHVNS